MKRQEFREISPELLQIAYNSAWSIENMETHGAGERSVEYIGSKLSGCMENKGGKLIYDYYRDSAGGYWYKNRVLIPSGDIVSMEIYLFGHELRKKRKR